LQNLYRTNYPWLENYIRRNSGNTEDAQDIFQEALIAAWSGLMQGRFKGSADSFNGYLRQTCKYKWINHLRSQQFKRTSYMAEMTEFDGPSEDSDELNQQLQHANQLKGSWEKLEDKCREVLGAFYYQRSSLAQIAIQQQNTEESIKTIKYRCMMRLRKLYLEKNKANGKP